MESQTNYYRCLNKELIEHNQTMRLNLKAYCDEIIHLKKELMEKHESIVNLRKWCFNWGVGNLLSLVKAVDPDSEILPVLKEHVQLSERTYSTHSDCSGSSIPRISGESSTSSPRRSSVLATELQRSSSIMSARRFVRSTSPLKRNSIEPESSDSDEVVEDEQIETEQEQTNNNDFNVIYEESDELVDNYETMEEAHLPINRNSESGSDVADVNYEKSNELANNNVTEDEEFFEHDESIEVIAVDDSITTKNTLSDVTNTICISTVSTQIGKPPTKSNSTRGRHKKSNLTNQDNSTDNESDKEQKVTNRRRLQKQKLINKSVTDMEETLQESRAYSKRRNVSLRNKSVPIIATANETIEEATINSPCSTFTDMTLQNFENLSSSTPNSRYKVQASPRTTSNLKTMSDLSELKTMSDSAFTNSTTCRPSRHCKPTNLAEPTLKTKLRNETKTLIRTSKCEKK